MRYSILKHSTVYLIYAKTYEKTFDSGKAVGKSHSYNNNRAGGFDSLAESNSYYYLFTAILILKQVNTLLLQFYYCISSGHKCIEEEYQWSSYSNKTLSFVCFTTVLVYSSFLFEINISYHSRSYKYKNIHFLKYIIDSNTKLKPFKNHILESLQVKYVKLLAVSFDLPSHDKNEET